jgi:hypothetical protein
MTYSVALLPDFYGHKLALVEVSRDLLLDQTLQQQAAEKFLKAPQLQGFLPVLAFPHGIDGDADFAIA